MTPLTMVSPSPPVRRCGFNHQRRDLVLASTTCPHDPEHRGLSRHSQPGGGSSERPLAGCIMAHRGAHKWATP